VLTHVHDAIATIEPADSPHAVRKSGAETTWGQVRFTGPRSAQLDGRPVRFRQALVATGSEPVVPDLPGMAAVEPLTTDTLWELTSLPGRLAVLGGGTSGCELAQALARLGVAATVVEAGDRLLGHEDPDAPAAGTAALERDGVDVRTGVSAVRAAGGRDDGRLLIDDGSEVAFDRLLVAVGRRPRTPDLALALAGVELGDHVHIIVDDALRTTNPRIWAAGDVTGHPQHTHVAGVHGSLAASNAVLGLRRKVDLSAIPRVTFTQPEVAAVGNRRRRTATTVARTPARQVIGALVLARRALLMIRSSRPLLTSRFLRSRRHPAGDSPGSS
jgi:pyruvate/2-oxoglutarate dehydrogenase complex dihydrolipoamide dehydrogenase (E3) component